MSTVTRRIASTPTRGLLIALLWIAVVAVAPVAEIVAFEVLSLPAVDLIAGKTILLVVLLAASLTLRSLRRAAPFMIVLTMVLVGEWARAQLSATPFWTQLIAGSAQVSLFMGQVSRFVLAITVIVLARLVCRRRLKELYLGTGRLRAPMKAVVWLGFKDDQIRWSRFGWLSALAIAAGTLVFLLIGGGPQLRSAGTRVLVNLPIVLLLATMNAFSEEVTFRSVLLAPLRGVISPRHAIMMTAVLFGLLHFYGVPYGFVGVAMSTLLGWLLGKAMVETGGLFWPWFIHFVQDVLIFSFVLIGLQPGS